MRGIVINKTYSAEHNTWKGRYGKVKVEKNLYSSNTTFFNTIFVQIQFF